MDLTDTYIYIYICLLNFTMVMSMEVNTLNAVRNYETKSVQNHHYQDQTLDLCNFYYFHAVNQLSRLVFAMSL
jgi:hypothetical protein